MSEREWLSELEKHVAWVEAEAERMAAKFVLEGLEEIADAPDGGVAHWRAIVDHIFFDAAYHDAAGDMENAAELLAIAQRAIARATTKETQHKDAGLIDPGWRCTPEI